MQRPGEHALGSPKDVAEVLRHHAAKYKVPLPNGWMTAALKAEYPQLRTDRPKLEANAKRASKLREAAKREGYLCLCHEKTTS